MLDELENGDVYMKMSRNPKRRECLHLCCLSPVVPVYASGVPLVVARGEGRPEVRQGRHG